MTLAEEPTNEEAPFEEVQDGLATEVRQDLDRIVATAAEEADRLLTEARAYGYELADRQKRTFAATVNDIAESLRSASEAFDERPNVKSLFWEAAGTLDDIGESIFESDLDDIYNGARDYAREHPLIVAGAGAAIGFAIARFVKSSTR